MKRDNTMRPQDLTQTQPISLDVLKEKYLKPGEDGIEDLYRRVARALGWVENEEVRAEW
jgi:ribonucleoside-diphosphate reductase alpha chain